MSASLALEKDLTIAFLGPEATWTHQAARSKFGLSVKYAPESSISDVFARVTRGTADYGVVPIENSVEGAVNHTLDVFMDSELKICAQILLRIRNDFLSKWPRDQIKKIYSHPQVFGQCRQWLQENARNVELIEVSSTTRAAQIAANEPASAALGSSMAAEVYGLQVLEPSVQDSPNNTTRFLVISPSGCPVTGNDKTSLMFSIQDRVGALYSALEPFSRLKLSMSKIESRPSKRKNWEYFFFVDVEGHIDDPVVENAVKALQGGTLHFRKSPRAATRGLSVHRQVLQFAVHGSQFAVCVWQLFVLVLVVVLVLEAAARSVAIWRRIRGQMVRVFIPRGTV